MVEAVSFTIVGLVLLSLTAGSTTVLDWDGYSLGGETAGFGTGNTGFLRFG